MRQKSSNSDSVRPLDVEKSGEIVIVRRHFHLIDATEEIPEHYEYDEWQMTADQYEVYQSLQSVIKEQEDALVELADIISEVM